MSQQLAATPVEREPAWPPGATPSIVVSDARRAMDWYIEVFGAHPRGEPHVNADGTIGHAEVGLGDAVLMPAEASGRWPDVPVRAPDSPVTFSHTLHLEVDDVDASTERAQRSGASVEREPADRVRGAGRGGGGAPRPRGRARPQTVRAVHRMRRRPGRDVPPLAAGRLTEALETQRRTSGRSPPPGPGHVRFVQSWRQEHPA